MRPNVFQAAALSGGRAAYRSSAILWRDHPPTTRPIDLPSRASRQISCTNGIGNAVDTVPFAHDEVGRQQFVDDGLGLLDPHLASDRF